MCNLVHQFVYVCHNTAKEQDCGLRDFWADQERDMTTRWRYHTKLYLGNALTGSHGGVGKILTQRKGLCFSAGTTLQKWEGQGNSRGEGDREGGSCVKVTALSSTEVGFWVREL